MNAPTATTTILALISPYLVALLRKCAWDKAVVDLLAVVIIVVLFVLGQWLDGALTWPLAPGFWAGLMAAYGLQQLAYKFAFRGSTSIERVEDVGNETSPQG